MTRSPRAAAARFSRAPAIAVLAAVAALSLLWAPSLTAQASERPESERPESVRPEGEDRGTSDSVAAPDTPPRIAGFFDVPWHADSAEVVERMGPPISVARAGDGVRIFHYTPWFLDRDGFLGLWMAEDAGMVGGSYEPVVGDCTRMLHQMVRELNRRHRGLSPATRGDVGDGPLEKDLCLAAMEDSARLTVTWEDAEGNRIQVGSRPGRPALIMSATVAGWQRP